MDIENNHTASFLLSSALNRANSLRHSDEGTAEENSARADELEMFAQHIIDQFGDSFQPKPVAGEKPPRTITVI